MKSENKDKINQKLGKTFKEYREKLDFTQDKVAEELDISNKYISKVEVGTGGVKLETLVNYINLLGIEPNILFKDLITNEKIKKKIKLSESLNDLNENEIDFIIKVIEAIKELRNNENNKM